MTSIHLIERVIAALLQAMAAAGGELSAISVCESLPRFMRRSPGDDEIMPSGEPRWMSVLHTYSAQMARAGLIDKGLWAWRLTDDGWRAVTAPSAHVLGIVLAVPMENEPCDVYPR